MAFDPVRAPSGRHVAASTAFVVVCLLSSAFAGQVVAQGSYSVEQGDRCFAVTPIAADESPVAFYDYRTPFPDNPYSNTTGTSYSSVGTTDLQRPNTSLLFLYEGPTGNLNLVFVHGTFNDGNDDGGSVTFDVTGLPEDGEWTVKDDEYDDDSNFDVWEHTATTASIDWTWGEDRTDGGVYTGLGDAFAVTVDPAFNENATLYGQYYNGTVADWTVLSGDRASPDRTALDLSEPVTVSTRECDTAPGSGDDGDDGVPKRDDQRGGRGGDGGSDSGDGDDSDGRPGDGESDSDDETRGRGPPEDAGPDDGEKSGDDEDGNENRKGRDPPEDAGPDDDEGEGSGDDEDGEDGDGNEEDGDENEDGEDGDGNEEDEDDGDE